MKQAFTDKLHLSKVNAQRLEVINGIIEEYLAEGYRLTLRQLYYQLVSRDIIPNNAKEYGKISTLLKEGRMAGRVDWEAIEDRVRTPHIPYYVSGINDAIKDTIDQYRLDRMKDQDIYIEVWTEKDALSGILTRVTDEYHIRLVVNRGYSSCSAMYEAYERFNNAKSYNKNGYILYLGDHDPSGLDMLRDIRERLEEFRLGEDDVEIQPIALTQKQIDKYNPPPNPAKEADPRAMWYIRNYGNTSWEVDALNPRVLTRLITAAIEKLIDRDKFNALIEQEEKDKKLIKGKFKLQE
jgi:hypothetical protein